MVKDSNNVSKKDLIITYIFNAPIERVWEAWVKPDLVKQWWGPDNFDCLATNIDFREGGTSMVSMASSKLGFPEQFSTWHYTKIVPKKRIEYIHNLANSKGEKINPASVGMPADFPQDMLHTVMFEELSGGKTKLTVTEKDWPAGQMMEMSKMGMEQCLNKMAKAIANHDE